MRNLQEQSRFLSRIETAKQLGISLPTLARRLADGTIPHTKIGGRVLIPTEYLQKIEAASFSAGKEE
jgi:excisionase family DNA binding protein